MLLNSNTKINYFSIIKSTYYGEGFMAFFKGWTSTQLNNTKLCIQFPLYYYCLGETNNIMISSTIAKIVSSTIFYPFDLIRTYQRYDKKNITVIECSKIIYKNNGIFGFYRGIILYNLLTAPNFVLMMIFQDFFKKMVKN